MIRSKIFPLCLLLGIAICAASADASVILFASPAAYAAATASTTVIGFNGILPAGSTFEGFNPLVVSGVSFATPTAGAAVNVTTADFYSPNNYPADFIVDAATTSPVNTLNITLPSSRFALALDYGGLFGGTGVITLSNGFVYTPASLPTVGNTAFIGFVSTTPITGLSYVVTGGSWVVEDLKLSSPVPEPGSVILMSLGFLGVGAWRKLRAR